MAARPLRRGTLASTPNTSICAHLRTRSATMMTRASLDPIFLQKMRKRFRGDRPPDERACEYSTSCIDMRADELLISACAVNRAAGRRKPGVYSGPGGQREIRSAAQGGAVDERGSSVRQLRAGNRTTKYPTDNGCRRSAASEDPSRVARPGVASDSN
jgi:hypothetical protein